MFPSALPDRAMHGLLTGLTIRAGTEGLYSLGVTATGSTGVMSASNFTRHSISGLVWRFEAAGRECVLSCRVVIANRRPRTFRIAIKKAECRSVAL